MRREAHETLLNFPRRGDTVKRTDRLTRSVKDIQDIAHTLKERDVPFKATEQPIDTRSAPGKAFLEMPDVFAKYEINPTMSGPCAKLTEIHGSKFIESVTPWEGRGALFRRNKLHLSQVCCH